MKEKKKLCSNCDGMVDFQVIVCPYCGNDMNEESKDSLYSPPYQPRNIQSIEEKEEIKEENVSKKNSIISFLIFSIGVNLLLFGLYLVMFSSKGEIFLRFNSSYWLIYFLLGSALSFVGYRLVSKN